MLQEPFLKSLVLIEAINRREVGILAKVPQGVEDPTHEESLSNSVGQRLDQVPAQPVYLIDAIVTDSKLRGKED